MPLKKKHFMKDITIALHTTTCITHSYSPMTYLVVLLPCIVSPPWPGRASHATPRCVSPAVGLMEMSACSWSIHFDAMNCSGVHTLPMCQITVCIQLCDIWTQRYWEEVWDISNTFIKARGCSSKYCQPTPHLTPTHSLIQVMSSVGTNPHEIHWHHLMIVLITTHLMIVLITTLIILM